MKTKDKPIHQHDCDSCIYLGRWISEEYVKSEEVDLWVCPNARPRWTPIVRWGTHDSYASGSSFAKPRGEYPACPDLAEAGRRALEQGAITQEQWDNA